MDKVTLKAFRAPDEPELSKEFLREHRQVLADFGIENVSTNSEDWLSDPNAFIIVALHETLGMVGGIRLQVAAPGVPLPMETAIGKLDPRIAEELELLRAHGNGEVCSLWNANRYANKGIPVLLSQAVTAMASMANVKRMVCLVAHYTQRHPRRNGFVVMEQVGDKGCFSYPIPSIKAIAMVNKDTMVLPDASNDQRHLIYSLRLRPRQIRIEAPNSTPLEIHYDMQLQQGVVDLLAYQSIQEQLLGLSA
ncbi:MAG: hypothetical protein R2817_00145 [Flavobacteriales bacterium]